MLAKKCLLVGILTLLSFSLAIAAPPAEHPATGEPLVIDCLKGTPDAIDGDLSDWNLEAMVPAVLDTQEQINSGQSSWDDPEDCSGEFYLLWDDENIYIAVIVKDDTLSMNKSGADIWNADCVEIFFGTTNAVSGHDEHYQYGFNANEQRWNWCNMDGNGDREPDYLQIASSETADGYICEASIPYGQMLSLDFTVGNAIGFHPVIDDTDNDNREIQMTWTSREAHDQSQGYGHVILSAIPVMGLELSSNPSPANDADYVIRDTELSWEAGEFAATHDLYLGTNFEDVNTATVDDDKGVLVGPGLAGTSFDPGRLEFEQIYFWRVDEVNGTPDNTIFKGEVWSFTVEPMGYPISGENIIATASSNTPGNEPENTINGSGLDESSLLHNNISVNNMWLSSPTGEQPTWIHYEFDKVYKMHQMLVWNSNDSLEPVIGFGVKEVIIEYSADGVEYMTLGTTHEFARAPGRASYEHNTTIDFNGLGVKYVRLTANSNWGGLLNQFGLSEIRFLHIPVDSREPNPASGTTDVALDVTLGWRAGRGAVSHNVYFSDDMQAVLDGSAPVVTVNNTSYGPLNLDLGTTYYWRVDEVNEAQNPDAWQGSIWNFATQEYLVLDDFEDYNDYEPDTIYLAWADGYDDPANGSTSGYPAPDFSLDEHFVETEIVHGGDQSYPYFYDNTAAPKSEATLSLDSSMRDWTRNGIGTLSLWYIGDAANASEPMYVTLDESATAMNEDANAAQVTEWTPWNIDLQIFADQGVNLANVTAITIGFGDSPSGGSGLVFFDDIRLYSSME